VVVKWGDRVRRYEEREAKQVFEREPLRKRKQAERGSKRQSAPRAQQRSVADKIRSRNAFPRNSPKPDVWATATNRKELRQFYCVQPKVKKSSDRPRLLHAPPNCPAPSGS